MWATAPETEGVACGVGDPIEEALCKFPELRGLKPQDLARVLKTTPGKAQTAILRLAMRATHTRITFEGLSFDDAISRAGKSAPRQGMKFSPDAGGIDLVSQVIEKAKPYIPALVALALVVAIFLEGKSEEA